MHLISGGDTGGARTHVLQLINGLSDRIQVDLVTLMESDFTEDANNLRLPLHVMKQKSRLDLSVTRGIEKLVRERNINLIHVHGARANFIATFIKKDFPNLPIVTTIHSDYLLDDYRGGQLLTRVFRKMNEHALRKIDYYIGVSDEFKSMMIKRGFTDLKHAFAVYNGIDFSDENFSEGNQEGFLKEHQIEFQEETVYVGIMGRMDPVKDHYTFLKAAKKVLETRKNVQFLIAGEGKLKASLEKFTDELGIQESVHFIGYVNQPFEFFDAIDINVLTSLSESFPYVMLEGARMKVPIVTTDVGGIDRVVKTGMTGAVLPVGDYEKIAEAILSLVDDKKLRKQLGENLYESVKDKYSEQCFIEKHLEIYKIILEESK
jgi:glycosyltransferase involved in cell wall biosynthesis